MTLKEKETLYLKAKKTYYDGEPIMTDSAFDLLEKELVEVEKYLINEANEIADYHLPWAENMKAAHHVTAENVQAIVQQEVGLIFKQVLEHAGVFKRDEKGQAAFNAFVTQL